MIIRGRIVMKNMLNFKDYSKEELTDILNLALDMKKDPQKYAEILKGKKLLHCLRRLPPEHFYRSRPV